MSTTTDAGGNASSNAHATAGRTTGTSSSADSRPCHGNEPTQRSYPNTVAAVAIAPSGVGDELSTHVAQAVRVIRDSGLPHETNAMFTNLEGDLDTVLRTVRDAAMALAGQGLRTAVTLKLDIRPGFSGQISAKAQLVDDLLSRETMTTPHDAKAATS